MRDSRQITSLIRALDNARVHFRDRTEKDEDEPRREAAWLALGAVIQYLSKIGTEIRLQAPLIALRKALEDASAGRSDNPILKPATYDPKRPRLLTEETVRLTLASAIVTLGKKPSLTAALSRCATAVGLTVKDLTGFRNDILRHRANSRVIALYQLTLNNQGEGESSADYAQRLTFSIKAMRPSPRRTVE